MIPEVNQRSRVPYHSHGSTRHTSLFSSMCSLQYISLIPVGINYLSLPINWASSSFHGLGGQSPRRLISSSLKISPSRSERTSRPLATDVSSAVSRKLSSRVPSPCTFQKPPSPIPEGKYDT